MTPPLFPAEQISVTTSDYSIRLVFALAGAPEPLCVIVIPHAIAKQLAMILRNQLVQVEKASGAPIRILPAAYKQMGVAPEDWPQVFPEEQGR